MQDGRVLLAAFADLHDFVGLHGIGWNVHPAAVDVHMAMSYKLTALRPRRAEAGAIEQVIETPLEHIEHGLAGDTFGGASLLKQIAELSFEQLIIPARSLLFAKLETVADNFRLAVFTMLPGRKVALFDSALFGVAALAFQE